MLRVLVLLLIGAAHAVGADFSVEFMERDTHYNVRFAEGSVQLSGTQFTLEIQDKKCSRKLVVDYRKNLEVDLGKKTSKASSDAQAATLIVQGITTRISNRDPMARRLRRVPFDIFTLRQAADRACKKAREVASADALPSELDPAKAMSGMMERTACPHCPAESDGDTKATRDECIKTICPDPDFSLKRLTDAALKIDAFEDPDFKSKASPLIDRIRYHEGKARAKKTDLIAKLDPERKVSHPLERAILNFFLAFSQIPIEALDLTEDGAPALNPHVLKKLRPDWSPQQIMAADQVVKLRAKVLRENQIYTGDIFTATRVFSREDTLRQIGADLEWAQLEIDGLSEEQRTQLGFLRVEIEHDLKELKGLEHLGQFPRRSMENLAERMNLVILTKLLSESRPSAGAPISLAAAGKEIRENHQRNVTSKSAEMDRKAIGTRESCAATFSILKTYSPTREQVSTLKSQQAAIIEKFVSGIEGLLSKASAIRVRARSKQWDFALPPNQADALKEFQKALEFAAKREARLANHNPKKITVADVVIDALEADPESSGLDSICITAADTIEDGAIFEYRKIFVSPIVAKLWPETQDVLNHEMGHLLSDELKASSISGESKKTKREIDKCLASQHPKAPGSSESKFTSEDFADFVGPLVAPEAPAVMCLMLRDMAEEARSKDHRFSLVNPIGYDSHSSDLFRVLHQINIKQGSIPKSCMDALEAKGEVPRFKDCRPRGRIH